MILKKSKEELEWELEVEMERAERFEKERERQRKFELEKARLELSVPKRWDAIQSILYDLFAIPVMLFMALYMFLLALFKREIPESFKNYIDSHS